MLYVVGGEFHFVGRLKGAVSATPLFCLHLGIWLTKLLEISTKTHT